MTLGALDLHHALEGEGINSAVEEIETARALQKPTRTCDRSMRVTPISASSALICCVSGQKIAQMT